MAEDLDRFFRCMPDAAGWTLQVALVRWDGQTPYLKWADYRVWAGKPDDAAIDLARAAALHDREYFRTCSQCGDFHPVGHMDQEICHGCAELGGAVF